MLDPQSLSQLRQLKQQLNDAIERAEGTVVAAQAQGRFGFVKLDDGRETFLPPEEMQRVFPGDRVQVRVLPAAEADRPRGGKGRRRERPRAELEKLLDSPLEHFTGQDRKSTRLNSSHVAISYAVFCLKKKKKNEK